MNFDNLIERLGSAVALKTVTLTSIESIYGTQSESYAESSIKAVFTIPKIDDVLLREGILKIGDMYAYIKTTLAIKEGDRIYWNSSDWEVVNIQKMPYQAETAYLKVGISRRQDVK